MRSWTIYDELSRPACLFVAHQVQLSASMCHEKVVKTLDYATSSGSTKGRQLDPWWAESGIAPGGL